MMIQALPYGAIGFISHILTYYTIICLLCGVPPLCPWRDLQQPRLNMGIAVSGVLLGNTVTIVTIFQCHRTWELTLIAVWKSALSVALAGICAHGSLLSAKITEAAEKDYKLDKEAYEQAQKIQKKTFRDAEREERMLLGLPLRGLDRKGAVENTESPPPYDNKDIKQSHPTK